MKKHSLDSPRKVKALRLALFVFVLATIGLGLSLRMPPVLAQQGHPACVKDAGVASCSPAQLGVSALTEPGSGSNGGVSALSSIIDMRGVTEATLLATCTQGNWSVNVQTYAEDGTTTHALITPVSALAANALLSLTIGEESNPSSNLGTLSTTALVRFPQRAIAISTTNASVTAGTCTARLLLSYH